MPCPLCHQAGGGRIPETQLFRCPECQGVYRHEQYRLSPEEEKARYENHNNDVNDPGYQQFVMPIVAAVLRDFRPEHSGLDFGAGTGPVITKLLREQNFNLVLYDPFFHHDPDLLKDTYDYIVCCEVIEHFHNPDQEFALLKRLLKKQGRLYCMTSLYRPDADFKNWHYVRDPTHVFIYQPKTMDWIRQKYNFSACTIQDRLITMANSSDTGP